jgi:hypothetical protein
LVRRTWTIATAAVDWICVGVPTDPSTALSISPTARVITGSAIFYVVRVQIPAYVETLWRFTAGFSRKTRVIALITVLGGAKGCAVAATTKLVR